MISWTIPGLICPACEQSQPTGDLCLTCASFLEPISSPCPQCSAPDSQFEQCGTCLKDPPLWQSSYIGWHFTGLTRHLIHHFKYQQDMAAGFGLIRRFTPPVVDECPDALLPVPMFHRKHAQKGFNQAETIAKALSRTFHIPLYKGVHRQQATQPLEGLSKQERQKALKNVFECREQPPKRVAVIDDVMTSGATFQELTRVLLANGTEHVSVWALARTPLG